MSQWSSRDIHLTDGETEARRAYLNDLKSLSRSETVQAFNTGSPLISAAAWLLFLHEDSYRLVSVYVQILISNDPFTYKTISSQIKQVSTSGKVCCLYCGKT